MRSLRTSALLSLVLVVGLIAGCGSGDSSTSSTPSGSSGATGAGGSASAPASSDDYSNQVNALLATFNKDYSASTQAAGNPSSPEDYLDSVTKTEDAVKTVVTDLNGIEPPSDDAAFHQDLIAAFTHLDDGLSPLIQAAKDASGGDVQGLQTAAAKFATETGAFVKSAVALGAEAQKQGLDIPSLVGAQ